jgi:hypothetical protein
MNTIEIKYQDNIFHINKSLAERQGVKPDIYRTMAYCYWKIYQLFDDAKQLSPTDKVQLRNIAEQVKETEFQLQACWNFSINENYHIYWYRIPHCKCPKMDNRERVGTGMNIFSADCPIHGKIK